MNLDAKIPSGPIAEKWTKHKFDVKVVNPANKRKYSVIVVGSGLAGAQAVPVLMVFKQVRGVNRHRAVKKHGQ